MINLPFKVKTTKKESNRSIFEIKPLYPGYGITIGNALRRVLLSSIEGAAITQVKIKNVNSEFTTIPGVKEDTLEITLNLKNIKLKILGDEPQKMELKATGEKEIKAGDIKTPPQVEIINKDLHIASLTKKNSKIEMEITVEKGLGYVRAEKLQKEKSQVGVIYLDAIFTPIEKVSFTVENIMFEKRADYNKLKIEIQTDGSIKPEEALERALEILSDHISFIKKAFGGKEKTEEKVKTTEEKTFILEDLNLSARTLKILDDAGIKSLEGLTRRKEDSLKEIKGMGDKAIKEIKTKLKRKGLELK